MNEMLYERRRKMLTLLNQGISLSQVVKTLSQEHQISPRALYYDYKKRGSWLPYFIGSENQETFLYELLVEHKRIQGLALVEYRKADNSNARIGALRLMREINKDFIELHFAPSLMKKIDLLEAKVNDKGGEEYTEKS